MSAFGIRELEGFAMLGSASWVLATKLIQISANDKQIIAASDSNKMPRACSAEVPSWSSRFSL
jgi:hypothetical protein